MSKLEDQLKHAFSDRKDRVRQALEQSRRERSRYSTAEETRRQHQQELSDAQEEMQRLPGQAAKAILTSDVGEGAQSVDTLKARYQDLEEIVADRRKRLREIEGVLNHEDVHSAEQLSIGRAQQISHAEVQAARKERDQLVETLNEALAELEKEAAESVAIKQVYEKEAS